MGITPPKQREVDLLGRSAFALLFIGAFITVASVIPLALNGAGRLLYILYGAILLLVLGAMGFILLAPVTRVRAVMSAAIRLLARPLLALFLGLVIVMGNVAAPRIINTIVPQRSATILLMTFGWSILFIALLAISNATLLTRMFARARSVWVGIGIVVASLFALFLIVRAVDVLLQNTQIVDRVLGKGYFRDTFRNLIFYGNEMHPEWAQRYWGEQASLQFSWISYIYIRPAPFHGQFINIDDVGLRATSSFVQDTDSAPTVFFFGGSTMWGYGARDDYTIPSQIARRLNDDNRSIHAVNYAQLAYVSTQDLILFQRQLALGNIPDIAIFYEGNNDLTAIDMDNKIAGLPQNEINRARDLIAGQIFRDNRGPLLSQPDASFDDLDFSLVGIPDASPEQVVGLFLENLRQIRAVARDYGVRTLFVWQPALLYKQLLTPQEQIILDQGLDEGVGLDALYRAADTELRRRVESEGLTDVLILSDLFAQDATQRFIDLVHVTEDANTVIADAIDAKLTPLLSQN